MSDDIRKVIVKAASYAFHDGIEDEHDEEDVAVNIMNAIRAAGYEIVPKWSTDMDAAPKDGTPVRLYSAETGREYVASYMTSMEEGGGQWIYARQLSAETPVAFIAMNPTHWKPITPPETSE